MGGGGEGGREGGCVREKEGGERERESVCDRPKETNTVW